MNVNICENILVFKTKIFQLKIHAYFILGYENYMKMIFYNLDKFWIGTSQTRNIYETIF